MQERTYIQYLSKIHVEGYKILENAETHFLPGLNILIGKNGSGKSTFLEFITNVLNAGSTRQRVASYNSNIELTTNEADVYLFSINNSKRPSNHLAKENQEWGADSLESSPEIHLKKKNKNAFEELEIQNVNLVSILKTLSLLRIRPIRSTYIKFDLPTDLAFLSTPGTISFDFLGQLKDDEEPFPELSPSFVSIILFLGDYKKKDLYSDSDLNKLFPINEQLKTKLKTYSPVKDIRISPNFSKSEEDDSVTISFVFFEFFVNDKWLIWDQLSDGTKRLFYIIFSLHYTSRSIVLLEEPELGVHPHQLHQLMDFIKEESKQKQVIISTHSPYVLDILNADELDKIIVTKYEKGKGTQFYHLSEEQKETAQKYIKEFGTISDYWLNSDLEGEDK